jgi:hypothetical protein
VTKRIAIVVPRCHERLVGGAEALAWQYAQLLSSEYSVDVLTSTAFDYMRWDNDPALPCCAWTHALLSRIASKHAGRIRPIAGKSP